MPKSESSNQEANLDVLRSIAVLSVLVCHLITLDYFDVGLEHFSPFWYLWGKFGVMVFFVHTSLVLMMSLERQAARRPAIAVPFFIQRAFRIYPLSILCVLVVVICHMPADTFSTGYDRPGAFKLISNLLLTQNLTRVGSISGPLWSLPFELQMYAVLPFLYWLLKRHPQGWVMAGLVALSVGLGGLQLLAFAGKVTQYVPCFMGGILAFWLRQRQRAVLPAWLWPLWVIGLGLLYHVKSFFGDYFVVCLMLGASLGWFRELKPGFLAALGHQIAKYSYGIYLAHTPLILLCFRELSLGSQAVRWVLFLLLLPLVVVALYHGVESPMIRVGRKLTAPRTSGP